MDTAAIIRANGVKAGLRNDREISKRLGMPYSTLRYRLENPSTWKMYELQSLVKITKMPDEDILALVRRGK